ncbi:serine-arginine protein 55 isoform X1 [Nymphalis io]|uniref:serine-arginine protein 55 isoform X1 n=2 Tax=Nymphalini TaxID=171576 RepID=UPI0021675604|nr:serine-arginine protein 55 isoform X1 [Nymphalis io]XP_050354795.1 serine-arginine protein 55 isoform X1 [Nymphalis io]
MVGSRVYVGGLPFGVRERDLEKFFKGFGRIKDILIKNGYGFVEFEDYRDADDAVYELNGKELLGERVVVEPARGIDRSADRYRRDRYYERDRGRSRYDDYNYRYGPPTRTEYRLIVENLSSRISWQDLKDYMRQAGEVTYADAHKQHRNEGVVEFATHSDMRAAMEKLDGTELNGRRVRLVEDRRSSRRRTRSSSSRSRSRSRERRRSSRSRSRRSSRSRSKSRPKSKSPEAKSRSRSRSKCVISCAEQNLKSDRSRSRSASRKSERRSESRQSRERSVSHKSPDRNGRTSPSRSKSKSKSKSKSRSPKHDSKERSRSRSKDAASPKREEERRESKSRSRSRSRSASRERSMSRDRSRSASPRPNGDAPEERASAERSPRSGE